MKVAAITMVYNEGERLRRWARYYGGQLGYRNLLIIDHGSDDGVVDELPEVGRIRLTRTEFDDERRAMFISDFQKSLFGYFDVVVYTDCDEILVPDPAVYDGILDYLARTSSPCSRATGFDLFHAFESEPELDYFQPVLSQRHNAVFRSVACKPLVTRVPVRWVPGFHHCNMHADPDPHLILFHTKNIDFEFALRRQHLTRSMSWPTDALSKGIGRHQRVSDDEMRSDQFEQPNRRLERQGASDFAEIHNEIKLFSEGTKLIHGIYRCPPFVGKIYRIPDRFQTAF